MNSFSKRQGLSPEITTQIDTIRPELRNRLWNEFVSSFLSQTEVIRLYAAPKPELRRLIQRIWNDFFKLSSTTMPTKWPQVLKQIEELFFAIEWNKVYDLIELVAPYGDKLKYQGSSNFIERCNIVLKEENSAYRFVGEMLVPITNEIETSEVTAAMNSDHDVIRTQITSAMSLLSKKPYPDVRNCIKEAIGTVESASRILAGEPKATLGELLPKFKDRFNLHPAQVEGFKKLYGYTSNDNSGIRHGMMEKDNLSVDDGRYMVVICSAFANYLLAQHLSSESEE